MYFSYEDLSIFAHLRWIEVHFHNIDGLFFEEWGKSAILKWVSAWEVL